MNISKKLDSLKITIPEAPLPVGAYVAFKKINNLVFISGQLPIDKDGSIIKGKVGSDLNLKEAQVRTVDATQQFHEVQNGLGFVLPTLQVSP